MKVNSENLYKYINDLATDEKVKFKVYYDDNYVTQVYWNGESFEWDTGTFTSGAFFNPFFFIVLSPFSLLFVYLFLIFLKVFFMICFYFICTIRHPHPPLKHILHNLFLFRIYL